MSNRANTWWPFHRRRRRRLERSEWWEKFAVVVSAIAMLIAVYQSWLAREALTAADQHRTIEALMGKVWAYCDVIRPLTIVPSGFDIVWFKDGDPHNFDEKQIWHGELKRARIVRISKEQQDDWTARRGAAARDIDRAVDTVRIWISPKDRASLDAFMEKFSSRVLRDIGDSWDPDRFYLSFAHAQRNCDVSAVVLASWAQDRTADWPAPSSMKMDTPIPMPKQIIIPD